MMFVRICEYVATTLVFGVALLLAMMLLAAAVFAVLGLITIGGIWVFALFACLGLGLLVRFTRWFLI